MEFASDDYFHIGHEHVVAGKPCQDHALSGIHGGAAYAIVSDGCSTGKLTDVGARLMSLSTASAIREHWDIKQSALSPTVPDEITVQQRIVLGGVQRALSLDCKDMLATCAYVYAGKTGGLVHVAGDGVVAFVNLDRSLKLFRFDWANNVPFYPAYAEDGFRSFVHAHGNLSSKALTMEQWRQDLGKEFVQEGTKLYTVAQGIKGVSIFFNALELSCLTCVAVFTDGVTRVDEMDWKDAAAQLLAFKTGVGEFAKRRMIRFIQDVKKAGKGPLDDIAYAVVRIATDTETAKEGSDASTEHG